MRAKQIIDRYREFAARTNLFMGAFALALIVAIIVLMIVSAVPSQASVLTAEAKNLVTMSPTSDTLLVATVALVFLAVLAIEFIGHRNRAE
jgi:choline-glycine betaine transporter